MTWPRELLESGVGDCGCPEEEWLVGLVNLNMHFEPNGDVDCYLTAGDDGDATCTIKSLSPEAAREAAFLWVENHFEPEQHGGKDVGQEEVAREAGA